MAADIVFSGAGPEGAAIGTIQVGAIHDQFELRCPVCGHSVFSTTAGMDQYACETCGVEIHVFSDPANCRIILEVQGA